MNFFYSRQQLSTIVDQAKHCCFLRTDANMLATKSQDGHKIVAIEATRSTHGFMLSEGFRLTNFSPFGVSPVSDLPVGFKSEHPDPLTQHYLLGNGYRSYNPAIMRFNSPDSESPFARGGLNSYAFVQNDPVNRHDPTGHMFETLRSLLMKPFTKKVYTGKIVAEFDGIVAFTAPDRADGKVPTLYFSGHSNGGWFAGEPHLLPPGGELRLYSASSLYWKMETKIDMAGRPTHFLGCNTIILTETMSRMTGAQSSGYSATLATSTAKQGKEYTVTKFRVLPFHGMSSTKETVGNLRNPEKHKKANKHFGDFAV